MGGGQPPLGVLGQDVAVSGGTRRTAMVSRAVRMAAALATLGLTLTACTSAKEPVAEPTPSPTVVPSATPAPRPAEGACYRLTYAQAVAPTVSAAPVSCRARHTSTTYAVGRLDAIVDGHLLAVDSERMQRQVAAACPRRLRGFLGATEEQLRLSMLRAVWFTPTVAESDAGADWFRCDVIAVAGDERLAPLDRRLAGVLSRPEGRDRYGMCGTAAPDAPRFERVICSAAHSWRAVAVVELPRGAYPGARAARRAGQAPCEDAGRAAAEDPLDFEWGYEWPTRDQWRAGQTYGRCWAPD